MFSAPPPISSKKAPIGWLFAGGCALLALLPCLFCGGLGLLAGLGGLSEPEKEATSSLASAPEPSPPPDAEAAKPKAAPSREEPEPVDPVSGKTARQMSPAYQLARLDLGFIEESDPRVEGYDYWLEQVGSKVKQPPGRIADIAVSCQQELKKHQIETTLFQLLKDFDRSIPDGMGKLDLADIAAAYVVLKIGE